MNEKCGWVHFFTLAIRSHKAATRKEHGLAIHSCTQGWIVKTKPKQLNTKDTGCDLVHNKRTTSHEVHQEAGASDGGELRPNRLHDSYAAVKLYPSSSASDK